MIRKLRAFIILESEIIELKTIFYTDIILEFLSFMLMALCFYIWAYEPRLYWYSIGMSVLSFVFAGIGIYLSILQSRIWRHVRRETQETIDLTMEPSTLSVGDEAGRLSP